MLPALINGVSSNSGTNPMQAIVTTSFDVDNLPVERVVSSGAAKMGTGSKGDSYSIAQNELVVMDTEVTRPGMVPAVFSSLTGLDYDPRRGDAGLAKRMVPLGVAITRINFVSASGLYEPKVTVVTNGLVPLRWVSEEIRSPMPGDLFCAYPPKTDAAARHHQLTTVSQNSTGSRYHGDIMGDVRTPMLMKRFSGTEVDDLIKDALDMLVEAPLAHWEKSKNAGDLALSPVQSVLYNMILAMSEIIEEGAPVDAQITNEIVLKGVAGMWGPYMTTALTIPIKERYSVPNEFSSVLKKMLTAYRIAIQTIMSTVVGRVVGNRIDGTVPVYLG
jgi:hypothetical protein